MQLLGHSSVSAVPNIGKYSPRKLFNLQAHQPCLIFFTKTWLSTPYVLLIWWFKWYLTVLFFNYLITSEVEPIFTPIVCLYALLFKVPVHMICLHFYCVIVGILYKFGIYIWFHRFSSVWLFHFIYGIF